MDLDLLLKILFENVALIGVFFIMAGLVKVYLYYKFFNVYIFEFIDIKEILILFVNNLFAYFIILFFLAVTLVVISCFEGIKIIILPLVILVLSIVFKKSRKHVYWYETILQNVVYLIFFGTLLLGRTKIINTLAHPDIHQHFMLLIILGTLLVNSAGYAALEFYKVKYKGYYSKIRLVFEDSEFQSDENKFYIGKTEKYFFMYDKVSNTAEVIPAETIKKMFIGA